MPSELDIEDLVDEKFKDPKSERKVLAFFLKKNQTLCTTLFDRIFSLPMHRKIFSVIKQKNIKKLPRKILTVACHKLVNADEKGIISGYIKKIYETKVATLTTAGLEETIKLLKTHYESREILFRVGEIVSDVGNFNLQQTKEKLKEAVLVDTNTDLIISGDYIEDFPERLKRINELQENPLLLGVPTGIKEFDLISGGIQPGELGILLAQTGKGKTLALGNFGMHAFLERRNIIFVSLEMTKDQIQFRLDSRISKLEHTNSEGLL